MQPGGGRDKQGLTPRQKRGREACRQRIARQALESKPGHHDVLISALLWRHFRAVSPPQGLMWLALLISAQESNSGHCREDGPPMAISSEARHYYPI